MGGTFRERKGSKVFKQISRWLNLDYTVVSRNNKFAIYADNFDSEARCLNLTYFRLNNRQYPFRKFTALDRPIMLDNLTVLSKVDEEAGYYMEVDKTSNKIRLFAELI